MLAVDLAITSTTLCVSFVSKPNARNVEPAIDAASPKPTSNDAAKSRVDSVAFNISLVVKPNFANSVCSPTTSFAVN